MPHKKIPSPFWTPARLRAAIPGSDKLERWIRRTRAPSNCSASENSLAERLSVRVSAHTADGVPVQLPVSLRYSAPPRYSVLPENGGQAVQRLLDVQAGLSGALSSCVRARLSRVVHGSVLGQRTELAESVRRGSRSALARFGYRLVGLPSIGRLKPQTPAASPHSPEPRAAGPEDEPQAPGTREDLLRWEADGGASTGPVRTDSEEA